MKNQSMFFSEVFESVDRQDAQGEESEKEDQSMSFSEDVDSVDHQDAEGEESENEDSTFDEMEFYSKELLNS